MAKKRPRSQPVRVTMIGCGFMARIHLQVMLSQFEDALVPVVCELSDIQYQATAKIFADAGRDIPPNEPVLDRLLAVRRGDLTNPCPPEVGLRMSRLRDAIKASSAQGGRSVSLKDY